ncbi:MAG TPA: Holliday junction resolvase RuvX, partial [Gammaproteobacteria bacterium]|nr:Holliday junction resolvase RuvX [Gammaproteobacteria bacterium]
IGTATGQVVTRTATPLQIIPCHNNSPDWETISRLIEDWQPDAIVVGIPLKMDDSKQPMTEAAGKFMRQLQGRFHLPVYPVDERLSTFEARDRSGENNAVDSIAAQAILETWLAENNNRINTNSY